MATKTKTPTKPSIGRTVHYAAAGPNGLEHFPAVIIRPLEGNRVRLHVFSDVPLPGPGVVDAEQGEPGEEAQAGTWHWPELV